MFQSLWTLTEPGSTGTEEEILVSAEEQLTLDRMDKPDVPQTPAQAHHASNVEHQITGQTNVRTEEDNSI